MIRRGHRHSLQCPLCLHLDKTVLQMLTCPKTEDIYQDLLFHLDTWLQAHQTEPIISSFIITGLIHWFSNPLDSLTLSSTAPTLNLAFSSQISLGWYALLCGYISKHIVSAQVVHYSLISSKKQASSWGTSLIKQQWNMLFQLWNFRNKNLHDTPTIHRLSGLAILKQCIAREYHTGPADLDPTFNHFFSIPLTELL